MDDPFEKLKNAKKNIHIADHMLTQTYPLVKDSKLLIAVLDNIFLAMRNAMDSLLASEREAKTIPPFHDSFDAKLNLLKLRLAAKHSIDNKQVLLMQDLKSMIARHKESPMEFIRKDKFVICSEEYDLTSISVDQMKSFIKQAKAFVDKIESVIGGTDE
ncbi:MAG: hypothetical protein ACE5DM_03005 [Candidatus Nanoarchaeia archaeon]